ncbi:hypothetical protein ACPXAU_24460, partial [Salmonella enterica]|uniref:hypothetical protein n=1 Tax=Salmonella enterica TaxID=28901 RepID=UPI003CF40CC4
EDVKQLLEKIQSPDGAVRQAAWKSAGPVGAAAVVPLGELAASSQKPVARAAAFALDRIAHYAARPGSNGAAHAVAIEL